MKVDADGMKGERILVLDYGSQYTQLIARRIRESRVYCEIRPFDEPLEEIRSFDPKGIILSGGPASVYDPGAPSLSMDIINMGIPVLGICYGMQLIAHLMNGKVIPSARREYGPAEIAILDFSDLFKGIDGAFQKVWMSHGDRIEGLPPGFSVIARSENSPVAAFRDQSGRIYGVQFHPEVVHTPIGRKVIENFIFLICKCKPIWTMDAFIDRTLKDIRERVQDEGVILALSGGVDSSVTAILLYRAVGNQLTSIFVDTGLLQKGERERVLSTFRENYGMNLICVDARKTFFRNLKGIEDPEEKRKIIGNTFISIFEREASKLGKFRYLAQGTLYPDVIESTSRKGPSARIKSHHNVGGLPEKMSFELIEPLKELFKDEVRILARELGLPDDLINKHPFPGPGLAVRIIGEVTEERADTLREADAIVVEEIKRAGLYNELWQAFAILLPVRTVGVMGDERTYENVIAIRAVESLDGMTADWAKLPYQVLSLISQRIIGEVKGINRVVYDISSKPPSTIEWE